jgi:hypothetical protein
MGLKHEATNAVGANPPRSPLTETVIRKLRKLQGLGLITPAACICAERYIKRHPEVFNRGRTRKVNEAVELAVESAVFSRFTSSE